MESFFAFFLNNAPLRPLIKMHCSHRSVQAGTSWISVWYFLVEIIIYSLPVAL